jgi:hypothetical protein
MNALQSPYQTFRHIVNSAKKFDWRSQEAGLHLYLMLAGCSLHAASGLIRAYRARRPGHMRFCCAYDKV